MKQRFAPQITVQNAVNNQGAFFDLNSSRANPLEFVKATLFAAAWIVVSSRVLAEASPTITPEWQYRHAAQLCNEALVKNFDGRQDERIYVVPVNPVFDTATAFSQKAVQRPSPDGRRFCDR